MKSFLLFKLKTISHTLSSTALIMCLFLDHNNRTYLDCSNCQASMTENLMTHHNIIKSLHIFPCPNKFPINFKTQFTYSVVPSRITLATLLIFLSLYSKDTITLTWQFASWSTIAPNWFKQYLLCASYVQDRMLSIAFLRENLVLWLQLFLDLLCHLHEQTQSGYLTGNFAFVSSHLELVLSPTTLVL